MLERLVADDGRLGVMVVAAHPDDEIASLGGVLRRLTARGATIQLVHVTDGAPRDMRDASAAGITTRDGYARARRLELANALRTGGIQVARMHVLSAVDQEASFALVELTHTLADVLREKPPDIILTHAYEGGHPDHDAAAFIVHAAVARTDAPRIEVAEFPSYHLTPAGTCAGRFLEDPRAPERVVELTPEECAAKAAIRECFVTQRRVLEQFPLTPERVRSVPAYDFTRPPHDGTLFYELFNWGITGPAWRTQAADAMHALGLRGDRCA